MGPKEGSLQTYKRRMYAFVTTGELITMSQKGVNFLGGKINSGFTAIPARGGGRSERSLRKPNQHDLKKS